MNDRRPSYFLANLERCHNCTNISRLNEERLRLLLESTAEAIFGMDMEGVCTFCNPAGLRILGYKDPSELLGKRLHDLIHYATPDGVPHPISDCRIQQACRAETGIHVDNEVFWRPDGTSFPVEYWVYPQKAEGKLVGSVLTFLDITERRRSEERVEYLAYYDPLTGLPNRTLFKDRLRQAVAQARRAHTRVAVLCLDLDRFKTINDALGRSVGDAVLQHVADRLRRSVREQDTLARLEGDEFAIIMTGVHEISDVHIASKRYMRGVSAELKVLEHSLKVSCSIGASIFPDHTSDDESLLNFANLALNRAVENAADGIQLFDSQLNEDAIHQLTIENSLRRALEHEEFFLVYQPQVDLTTGELVGHEALLRWQQPGRGLIAPDKFIPIAERCGLIIPIGKWVLRQACSQAVAWHRSGLHSVPICINVSAVQFQQQDFVNVVTRTLEETQLPPQFLELEITESLMMSSLDLALGVFKKLNRMGVKLSIDDFGTGYSSLSYLKNFPIHRLKIDRSFVRDLEMNKDTATITSTIIQMGKGLGLKVIAEGVEREEQARFLQENRCDEAQGYLFSPPRRAHEVAGHSITFALPVADVAAESV